MYVVTKLTPYPYGVEIFKFPDVERAQELYNKLYQDLGESGEYCKICLCEVIEWSCSE